MDVRGQDRVETGVLQKSTTLDFFTKLLIQTDEEIYHVLGLEESIL